MDVKGRERTTSLRSKRGRSLRPSDVSWIDALNGSRVRRDGASQYAGIARLWCETLRPSSAGLLRLRKAFVPVSTPSARTHLLRGLAGDRPTHRDGGERAMRPAFTAPGRFASVHAVVI